MSAVKSQSRSLSDYRLTPSSITTVVTLFSSFKFHVCVAEVALLLCFYNEVVLFYLAVGLVSIDVY